MKTFLIYPLLLALLAAPAIAQETPTIPAEITRLRAALLASAKPTVRTWITNQATTAKSQPKDAGALERPLRAAIPTRFAGQRIGDAHADALVLLVMAGTMQALLDDLDAMLAEMKAARAESESLRELLAEARSVLDSLSDAKESTRCTSAVCVRMRTRMAALAKAQASVRLASTLVPRDAGTLGQLREAIAALEANRDSLAELGEEQQLRIRMVMDRCSKLLTMLSNVSEKLAKVPTTILQNLK